MSGMEESVNTIIFAFVCVFLFCMPRGCKDEAMPRLYDGAELNKIYFLSNISNPSRTASQIKSCKELLSFFT